MTLDEYSDKAIVSSNFERRQKDRYFTELWVTQVLIDTLKSHDFINFVNVWEPACGRGDMVKVLLQEKFWVALSDIDISAHSGLWATQADFLKSGTFPKMVPDENSAIITNPPFNKAEEFIRHSLGFDVELVAMLLRNEWDCAKTRTDLFVQTFLDKSFAMKVVLTSRPRWDDWKNKSKPDKSPRHNYAWFVWKKNYKQHPIIVYAGK